MESDSHAQTMQTTLPTNYVGVDKEGARCIEEEGVLCQRCGRYFDGHAAYGGHLSHCARTHDEQQELMKLRRQRRSGHLTTQRNEDHSRDLMQRVRMSSSQVYYLTDIGRSLVTRSCCSHR